MAYIGGWPPGPETPAGTINGINTTFVAANNIFEFDDIFVDGAIYLGSVTFTQNTSTFVLGDAPTVSVRIQYYTSAPPPTPPPVIGPNYYNSDMSFDDLTNLVLRSLHEPEITGSEAVSPALVQDTLNMVYAEAFNDQRMKQSAREENTSFQLANDTTLTNDLNVGDPFMTIDDASSFLPAGRVLALSEMIDYTTNDLNHVLGGLSGLQIPQLAGAIVRQMYPLITLAPTIQNESVQYLDVNGIPQTFMEYPTNITAINFYPNSYSIYKGFLIISRQSTVGGNSQRQDALMIYTAKVVPMSTGTDKPTLIPNAWRVPILVYGACMRIAAEDAFRTSWDWWKGQYDMALSQYIAFRNTRVKDINNRRRPTLYSRGGGGFSSY